MFKPNERVRVVESTWSDVAVGSLATVVKDTGNHVIAIVDGFDPTEFDVLMAELHGVPHGSLPFIAEELESADV